MYRLNLILSYTFLILVFIVFYGTVAVLLILPIVQLNPSPLVGRYCFKEFFIHVLKIHLAFLGARSQP